MNALVRMTCGLPTSIGQAIRGLSARVHPSPVIVLGNQKSGTTAIAALLAEIAGCSATLDIFFRLRRPALAQLLSRAITLDQFVRKYAVWFSAEVIKEPSLSFFHDELRELFPAARFVFIIRDPRDNIRSILNRLKIPGDQSALDASFLTGLPTDRGWRLILDGAMFKTAGRTYIETLANRWNRVADVVIGREDDFTIVRYEDFCAAKAETIERLARAVGLKPCCDVTDRVDVSFQPSGQRNVSWLEFFGPRNLETIEAVCSKRMTHFGYAASPDGDHPAKGGA